MTTSTTVDYPLLDRQLAALMAGETDNLANCANFVALLFDALPDINWLGVYVLRGNELVLGPFQGKPACTHIAIGQGVCGAAARQMKSLVVDDVHQFDGHIACDAASNSEIVVPLTAGNRLIGVLDVDSPLYNRFDADDRLGLEKLCRTFVSRIAIGNDGTFI